jgi:hypothetical protein
MKNVCSSFTRFKKVGGLWRLILGGMKEDYQKSFLLDSGSTGVISEIQVAEVSFCNVSSLFNILLDFI